jgi:choline dehydrogenase
MDPLLLNRRSFLKFTTAAALTPSIQSVQPDIIVVGGGSSGAALVHRLSADPSLRVLLLEAGISGEQDPAVISPGRWTSLIGSSYDWAYRTEPEAGMDERTIAFPRGKALGGTSVINAMIFVRGDRRSFDRWQQLGNAGWGYDDVLPLFKRLERNDSGAAEYRGADGPLAVSHCFDPHLAHRAFLAAAIQNGFKADARFDFNGPFPNGVAGYYQKNILDGRRHSAAAAFLEPAMSRGSVEVRTSAQVTRLLVEGTRTVGVEYVREGRREEVRAARGVVLCGGVVETPKLLMLSGIGPADHLRSHGIRVVADVPGVGQNLQDHVKLAIRWNGKSELPASSVTAGLFTHSSSAAAGSGTRPPDLQFHVGSGADQPDRFVTIAVSLVQPASRGEIRLRSADPLAAPIIRARYLSERADVDALIRGIDLARWFGEAAAFEPVRGDEVEPGKAVTAPAEREAYVRRASDTIGHAAGTCRMGPDGDALAVVDPRLRVRGVEGLWIADASIMPEVVNATPHAACVMIGEKCADFL